MKIQFDKIRNAAPAKGDAAKPAATRGVAQKQLAEKSAKSLDFTKTPGK